MKTNPFNESALRSSSAADAAKSECEEARQELTGDPDTGTNEAELESAPESEQWDPVPGSSGHRAPVTASADEDDEGRSDNERLVEEGIVGAERDRMVQAAREASDSESQAA